MQPALGWDERYNRQWSDLQYLQNHINGLHIKQLNSYRNIIGTKGKNLRLLGDSASAEYSPVEAFVFWMAKEYGFCISAVHEHRRQRRLTYSYSSVPPQQRWKSTKNHSWVSRQAPHNFKGKMQYDVTSLHQRSIRTLSLEKDRHKAYEDFIVSEICFHLGCHLSKPLNSFRVHPLAYLLRVWSQ